jgi:hypothetical protein
MTRWARVAMRWWAPWLMLMATAGASAIAQQREPAPPANPTAAKAFGVLEKHCARCHQQGRLERPQPAGKFGNVLHLGELAQAGRLVMPGNADASRLWTHMMRKLMPYDVYQEHNGGTGPDAEEILAVRDWIEREIPPHVRRGLGFARAKARKRDATERGEPVLAIAANKNTYRRGDVLTLRVSSTADCHLTLVSVDVRGRGTVIFPNELANGNALAANQELIVPAPDAGYLFRVKEPGMERVVALCNLGTGAVDGIRHDFERQRFTDLGDYRTFLAKAIAEPAVEPDRTAAKPAPVSSRRKRRVQQTAPPPPEPLAAPQKVLRTGVVFEVR